ncbi:MAG TPA: hypothetical protein VE442_19215 [Jatrophihabitans sp.]|nr:hypothetical protein [Jatrophihabitans sp.]
MPTGVSVSLTDSHQQIRSGKAVHYAARLTNSGGRLLHARLVVEVPGYVAIINARHAKITTHSASWRVTVRPGRAISRTVAAHIGTIANGDYRVTALASVYRGRGTDRLLVRTADADKVFGVTDQTRTIRHAPPTAAQPRPDGGGSRVLLVAVLASVDGVIAVGLAGLVWWRRRPGHSDAPDVNRDLAHSGAEPPVHARASE